MAVIRVQKTKDYTIMSNAHFKEKEMSLKAKGLLSLMLSLPDDWNYSIEGLVAICKENETSIKTTLKELKDFGYLEVIKMMPNQTESGRIEYVYNIYEFPIDKKQEGEKQGVENLGVEIQAVENQPQLITNKSNTKDKYINRHFTPPTLDEVKAYCSERANDIDAEQFVDYYEARGWELSKGRKIKDWKACIRTWERNKFNKKRESKIEIDEDFREGFHDLVFGQY